MKSILTAIFSLVISSALEAQTTVSFKPNSTIGQDAYVYKLDDDCIPDGWTETAAVKNFGTHDELSIADWTFSAFGCSTGRLRSFIRFSELNELPEDIEILEAKLILKTPSSTILFPSNSFYPGSPYTAENSGTLYRVMPGTANNWNESTITWNSHLEIGLSSSLTSPIAITSSPFSFAQEIDVTDIVSAIYNDIQASVPFANNGFMLKLDNEEYYRCQVYASSDHSDATSWPELIITFSGGACNPNFNYSTSSATPLEYSFNAISSMSTEFTWTVNGVYAGGSSSLDYSFPSSGAYEVCLEVVSHSKEICRQCETIVITGLGVDKQDKISQLVTVSPNPTNAEWKLIFEATKNESALITLVDVNGRIIKKVSQPIKAGANDVKISSEGLSTGMYFLEIESPSFVNKIVLSKM